MNTFAARRYEMLVRVREFGVTHSTRFPSSTFGGECFAAIGQAVTALGTHVTAQQSGRNTTRESSSSKAVAREALRDDLDAIVRTARAIAIDVPGLDIKFRMPRGNGDAGLLAAARTFRHDAAPLAREFTKYRMPEDFLQDLDHDITVFEEATRDQDLGKDTNAAARAAIEDALDTGLEACRRLDAVVANELRDDPATLAVWDRVRRIEARGGRSRATPAPAAEADAPEAARPAAAAATV
jgi:hypothetical protein